MRRKVGAVVRRAPVRARAQSMALMAFRSLDPNARSGLLGLSECQPTATPTAGPPHGSEQSGEAAAGTWSSSALLACCCSCCTRARSVMEG